LIFGCEMRISLAITDSGWIFSRSVEQLFISMKYRIDMYNSLPDFQNNQRAIYIHGN
jgi:hypothetical protein